MLTEYEIMFIIRPDIDDAEVDQVIERIEGAVTEGGGTLFERDDWGKRKLAYLIGKHARGHYVLLRSGLVHSAVTEIERRMRYEERILRFLVTNYGEVLDLEVRLQQAEERRKELADLAKRRREMGDSAYDELDRLGEDEEDEGPIDVAALD